MNTTRKETGPMTGKRTRGAGESGSILILSTVGVVVAVICAALAVDLGRLASDKRDDQKIADLAALDASRDLSQACQRANHSAQRNGLPPNSLSCNPLDMGNPANDVVRGNYSSGVFTPDPAGTAVRVTVRSAFSPAFPFVGGVDSTQGTAVAAMQANAGFSIGSSLANFSSADNVVLNKVFGGLLHNPDAVTLSALTYQGLASSTINLGSLATQLGFGSVDTLLTSDITLGQLLTATATVLNSSDTVLAAQVTGLASLLLSGTSSFKLGDFITAQQGGGAAASTGINVLNLISSSAQLANGSNLVDVASALSLPVPGFGSLSTKLGLTVIEPAKTYIGPVGGSVTTAQMTEKFTSTLAANPLGLGLLTISGEIPVTMTAAGATGTLGNVNCASPQGIAVEVAATPFTTSVSTILTVKSALGLTVATVNVGPASADSASATNTVPFTYPAGFTPTASPTSTPAVPPGLTLTGGQITVNVVDALGLGVSVASLTDTVLDLVNNTVSAVASQVVSPTFAALGLKLGQVDVAALRDAFDPATCGQPKLVG